MRLSGRAVGHQKVVFDKKYCLKLYFNYTSRQLTAYKMKSGFLAF